MTDQGDKALEGHVECRRPDNEDEIPTSCNVRVDRPHGLAHAALCSVAIVSFAKLFSDDETATGASYAVARRIHAEPGLRRGLSLPSNAAELLGTSQSLISSHT